MPRETAELSAFTGGLLILTTALPSTLVSCTKSLINPVSIAPYSRISGEWDACFFGNGAELIDYRHDQRHALLAAQFLGVAFGIARYERTVGARRRLGGPENAGEVVHLPLELVGFDEAVNAKRAEKVANSLPHAARRDFLAHSKGRRERTPVGTAQHGTENVDHNAESIAFVAAALEIGRAHV